MPESLLCPECKNYPDTPQHELGCPLGATAEEVAPAYNPRDFEPFAVAVDLTLFTLRGGVLQVLLVERGGEPFKGSWALPGGFLEPQEDAETAAHRELREETHIVIPEEVHLEQLKTYSAPKRDPRMRVVSVAFVALAANLPDPQAGDDAREARWWPVEDLLGENPEVSLAFDHQEILVDALERVRSKLEYTTLAGQFVEEPFTLSDLWRVYKAVWGQEPSLPNFRRKVLSVEGFVEAAGDFTSGTPGPRARLYRRGPAHAMQPAMMRSSRDEI